MQGSGKANCVVESADFGGNSRVVTVVPSFKQRRGWQAHRVFPSPVTLVDCLGPILRVNAYVCLLYTSDAADE